jgi:hypothetical protein
LDPEYDLIVGVRTQERLLIKKALFELRLNLLPWEKATEITIAQSKEKAAQILSKETIEHRRLWKRWWKW